MNIILVESDQESIECFIACLREVDEKIELKIFENSNLVIEHVKEYPADMLFTEVKLREMTGFSLINQVKRIQPSIFSVILTKTTEHALEAWSNHVDDYIIKSSLSECLRSSVQYMKNHTVRR